MNKRLRFCLVGRGSIGSRHAGNLLSLGCREMLAFSPDLDPRKDAAFQARFGIRTAHTVAAVEAFKPDVFIIANPTACHLPYARLAARLHCHVFMEKPLSHSMRGVAAVEKLFSGSGLVFCLGNNLRFHPALCMIKRCIEQGRFGRIFFARVMAGQYLPDWHPGEDYRRSYSARKALGGGAVLTLQHEIDYAYWLFGNYTNLKAYVRRTGMLESDVEDLAAAVMETDSGCLVESHVDYLQRPAKRSIHVQGEKGSVEYVFGDAQLRFHDFRLRTYRVLLDLKGYDPNRMYLDEMRDFIASITEGRKPRSTYADARYVLETCLKIKKGSLR